MKTLRIVPVAAAAIGLFLMSTARVASAEESEAEHEANRVAHDHVLCRKYGYEEGSDEFKHCVDVLAARRAEAKNEATAKRRDTSSKQRALSTAENSACDTRSEVVNGSGRANPHEGGIGTCSH
jgi:Skp family chaperone for outer membrane proteins